MKRETFRLTKEERDRFYRIKPAVGEAFKFWKEVAVARDLDPKSIYYIDGDYSGLPLGHGKDWCWPIPLKCKVDPSTVVI